MRLKKTLIGKLLHKGASPVAQLLWEREHGLPRDRNPDDVVVDQELPRTSVVLKRASPRQRRSSGATVPRKPKRTRLGNSVRKEETAS